MAVARTNGTGGSFGRVWLVSPRSADVIQAGNFGAFCAFAGRFSPLL